MGKFGTRSAILIKCKFGGLFQFHLCFQRVDPVIESLSTRSRSQLIQVQLVAFVTFTNVTFFNNGHFCSQMSPYPVHNDEFCSQMSPHPIHKGQFCPQMSPPPHPFKMSPQFLFSEVVT